MRQVEKGGDCEKVRRHLLDRNGEVEVRESKNGLPAGVNVTLRVDTMIDADAVTVFVPPP